MPNSGINGPGLAAIAAGSLFLYAGIKGYSVLMAVQDIISGKSGSVGQSVASLTGGSASPVGSPGNAPNAPADVSGNTALAQQLAAARGWTGDQWNALYALWTRESGFNNLAKNPTSGAYGIPQALPPTKMPFAAQEAGGSDARSQIEWGLSYIAERYGNPVNAETHEQSFGWY